MSNFIVNSFQIPNSLVDELMSNMSANALKCYMLITRKTTGWGKSSDKIATSQFMAFLGIKDKRTVFTAIKELIDLGLIKASKSNGVITEYYLVTDLPKPDTKNDTSDKKCNEPVTKNVPATSDKKCTSTKDTIKYTNTKDIDCDFELIKNAYNDAVGNEEFTPVKTINEKRKASIKKLIKQLEDPTQNGLINYFYDFAEKAPDWTRGKTSINFTAHFDYILRPETYIKFIEGSL